MQTVVRPARAADAAALLPLIHQLWPSRPQGDERLQAVFAEMLAKEDYTLLVAEGENGALQGFCSGNSRLNLYYGGKLFFVTAMVVNEALRGQGVGGLLLAAAVEEARRLGCKAVELDSDYSRTGAHAFYEANGFARRGHLFALML